ncbi:MAG: hypothetical protein JXB05_38470 [Myxococcaceae bacterium]|nr:hypothetical protein [Myxococcaceae bacterium]
MRTDVAALRRLRAIHLGLLWLLGWTLAGCATTPNRSFALERKARILLASSDGSATGVTSGSQVAQGYHVPGRKPNSQMPWEFFLGNAAHRLISYMYGVNHPGSMVFYNTKTLLEILQKEHLGDPSRLSPPERALRPDITDATALHVFEIKPWNETGLQEARAKVEIYLSALNRAVAPELNFMKGAGFHGQILVRFARGQYIWRLEWQTTEPGVVLYRWTRSQQRFESAAEAADAGQWVNLSEQEMREYGGWVSQAVEEMVTRREQLAAARGAVGVVIDVVGNGAVGFFWGAIFGRTNPGAGVQQPPTQGGGRVIPFPTRPPPMTPPTKIPAAMGR